MFILAIKKSLFAKSRQENKLASPKNNSSQEIYNEIHQKIVGDVKSPEALAAKSYTDIVMGDIVEKQVVQPKNYIATDSKDVTAFPRIQKIRIATTEPPKAGKSIFAQAMEKKQAIDSTATAAMECDEEEQTVHKDELMSRYGTKSVIVEDSKTAEEVHADNLNILSKMREEEILAERRKLMDSIGK